MRYEKDIIQAKIKKKEKKRKRRIVLIYICIIPVFISYLIFIFQSMFEDDTEFSFFGFKQYTIVSNSMKPVFEIDDLIFIKECKEDVIKEQDIITFKSSNETITHRVIRIENNGNEKKFITKGDSNNVEDREYVTYDMIKGKYEFKIAKLGKIMKLLKRTDLFFIIIIILVTLYLYERRINKKRIKRHNERIEYEKENK